MYSQIGKLQSEASYLKTQNSQLQDNNTALQIQIEDQQNQNQEKQDRLKDYTYQLALTRHTFLN